MDQTLIIISIIGGALAILSALVAVILFLVKVGGELAVHKMTLEDAVKDTNRAHDKIRNLEVIQAQQHVELAVLKTTLEYIRDGIDEIKTALRDHVAEDAK